MILEAPWIRSRAMASPDRTALVASDRKLTYRALHARACARAHGLRALGVGPGEIVAAVLESGPDLAELLHAVDLLGATLLPLNSRLTAPEMAFQLRDSRARVLLHGDDGFTEAALAAAEASATPFAQIPALADRPLRGECGERFDPRAALALLYTSGTSGRPKGALLSRANFYASAIASALHMGVLPGDRWLACMPLFHVGGLSILLRSVLYGTATWVHPRFDAKTVNRALDEEGITLLSLTATMLRRLLDDRGSRPAPPSLRCVLMGGSATPEPLLERGQVLGFPLAPTYGLTEACSQVATRRPGEKGGLAPLPGTSLRIVDDKGAAVEVGAVGEIEVRSGSVMQGYVHESVAHSAVKDGWLRTADVGRLDARGGLEVLDRRDDLIVSGGENIYPTEIERVLAGHPDVEDVGVAGVEDEEFGSRPEAWVVFREGRLPEGSLREFCRARLAGYKVPERFHEVASLPRNAGGKLLRSRLG